MAGFDSAPAGAAGAATAAGTQTDAAFSHQAWGLSSGVVLAQPVVFQLLAIPIAIAGYGQHPPHSLDQLFAGYGTNATAFSSFVGGAGASASHFGVHPAGSPWWPWWQWQGQGQGQGQEQQSAAQQWGQSFSKPREEDMAAAAAATPAPSSSPRTPERYTIHEPDSPVASEHSISVKHADFCEHSKLGDLPDFPVFTTRDIGTNCRPVKPITKFAATQTTKPAVTSSDVQVSTQTDDKSVQACQPCEVLSAAGFPGTDQSKEDQKQRKKERKKEKEKKKKSAPSLPTGGALSWADVDDSDEADAEHVGKCDADAGTVSDLIAPIDITDISASLGVPDQEPIKSSRDMTLQTPIISSPPTTMQVPISSSCGETVQKPINSSPETAGQEPINSSREMAGQEPINSTPALTIQEHTNSSLEMTDQEPINSSPAMTDQEPINSSREMTAPKPIKSSPAMTFQEPINSVCEMSTHEPIKSSRDMASHKRKLCKKKFGDMNLPCQIVDQCSNETLESLCRSFGIS